MSTNIICRTVQAVLALGASVLFWDAMLPGLSVSGLDQIRAWLAAFGLGCTALIVEDIRIQWATRQRREAGYRQRREAGYRQRHGMS